MKRLSYVFVLVLAVFAMLLSACGAPVAASAPVSSGGGSKPMASPVEFTGVIEAMNGNEWTIGGQTLMVDPAVVRDGPFVVGDTVKVEVQVQGDGSTVVSRIESPVAAADSGSDNSNAINSNDDNTNAANSNDDNTNAYNSNDDNSNASNSNDDSSNDSNSNDDNSNDSNSNDDSSNDNGSRDDNSGGGNSNDDSNDGNSGKDGGGDDSSGGGGGGGDDNSGGGDDNGGDDD